MTNPQNKNTPERIWAQIERGDPGTCWLWTGGRDTRGIYGKTILDGKHWGVHRLIYTLTHGPIPDGLFVCHACDVPLCCNPDHLWLGTAGDNNRDKQRKGRAPRWHMLGERNPNYRFPERMARGERSPHAKLTERQVIEIRALVRENRLSRRTIARMYGVTDTSIRDMLRGRTWRHLADTTVLASL